MSRGASVPTHPPEDLGRVELASLLDARAMLSPVTTEGSQIGRLPFLSWGIGICSSHPWLLTFDVQKDSSGVQQTMRCMSCSGWEPWNLTWGVSHYQQNRSPGIRARPFLLLGSHLHLLSRPLTHWAALTAVIDLCGQGLSNLCLRHKLHFSAALID